MQEPFDAATIIFALLAIFVVWKLRSVLGTRNGTEKPPSSGRFSFGRRPPAETPEVKDNVVRLPGAANDAAPPRAQVVAAPDPWKDFAEPGSAVAAGLSAIQAADPAFAVKPFIDGAKSAYEMIVSAFAAGDRATLRNLLAPDVYESFAAAIAQRESRNQKVDTTFVSMDKATLERADLRNRLAQITVRFMPKLITATHDADGTLVEGSPEKVVEMNDIWTFARDTSARDPNWKLVATEAGQ